MKRIHGSLIFLRSFSPSLFLLALAFVLFCSSCSVQKRRYVPGYYVSFKTTKARNISPASTWPAAETEQPVKDAFEGSAPVKDPLIAPVEPLLVVNKPVPDSSVRQKTGFSKNPFPAVNVLLQVFRPDSSKPPEPEPGGKKKLLAEAVISFFSTILGLAFLLFIAFFDVAFLPFELAIALMILCLVSAYVMGMIALIKKVKEPDKYRGVWMAALSIMLVTVALGFLILDTGF